LFPKKWPRLPNILHFATTSVLFYVPDGKISEKWTQWRGNWGDGVWHIDEHDGNVCVVFRSLPPVRLLPVSIQEEGGEVWLRPEGLEKLFHYMDDPELDLLSAFIGIEVLLLVVVLPRPAYE
jgi:hypothetical protein